MNNSTFHRPGVSDDTLTVASCHHVGDDECAKLYGFRAAGTAIPFRDMRGAPIMEGERPFARVRLHDATDSQKYHQRPGSSVHVFIPPGFKNRPKGSTLIAVEGEFKALALDEAQYCAVGLCGINGSCFTAKHEHGETSHHLHEEMVGLLKLHQPATLVFAGDADVVLNSNFAAEAAKLRRLICGSKHFSFLDRIIIAKPPVGGPKGFDDCRQEWGEQFGARFDELLTNGLVVPAKATAAEIFFDLLKREREGVAKLATSTGQEARTLRRRLIQSAANMWGDPVAIFELQPLLMDLLGLSKTELAGLVRDAKTIAVSNTPTSGNNPEAPETVLMHWEQSVNGADLLEHIAATYQRFCVLPDHAADVLAVWVVFTYVYEIFEFAAIMAVWSPEPECGKGRVLDVSEKIARNAFRTANASAAVLYHSVSSRKMAALIDEFDSHSPEQREAAGNILKSGFQSNGKAHRMTERNGEQVVVEFMTFCPKMLATVTLDTLDKATRTRSIGIHMQRKTREDKIAKFRRYDGSEIQRKCIRWAKDNLEALAAIGPLDVNECATDRQEDVWEPLVSIARLVGNGWEQRIRDAARHLSGSANSAATEAIGHQLLAAMRDYFAVNGDKADTKTLLERLNASGDFSDLNRGRGLNAHFLAKNLKPYGVGPRNLKIDGKTPKGYDRGDFEDAFKTYLSPTTQESAESNRHPATEPVKIDDSTFFGSATTGNGSGCQNSVSPNKDVDGSGVAAGESKCRPVALTEAQDTLRI